MENIYVAKERSKQETIVNTESFFFYQIYILQLRTDIKILTILVLAFNLTTKTIDGSSFVVMSASSLI